MAPVSAQKHIHPSISKLSVPTRPAGLSFVQGKKFMMRQIVTVMALLLLTGCGLGQSLVNAGAEDEQYKACVLNQVETLSANNGGGGVAVEKATEIVIAACKPQEDVYVVSMTDLVMTMTGSMVSKEKFLEDEEANLRRDLHDMAANLVTQNL